MVLSASLLRFLGLCLAATFAIAAQWWLAPENEGAAARWAGRLLPGYSAARALQRRKPLGALLWALLVATWGVLLLWPARA